MSHARIFLLASLVAFALHGSSSSAAGADAGSRTWTSERGTTLEATFVEAHGSTVVLRGADGKTVQIERNSLSDADRAYLETLRPAAGRTAAADWSGWRGANRDGKSCDTGLLKEWPAGGPPRLWEVNDIGDGFSSAAVSHGMVYISGMVDGNLMVFALDADGKPKWKSALGREWSTSFPGARSSPVIDEGRLYITTGNGQIGCLDATTGKQVWTREMSEFGGRPHGWGFAESVLIAGELAVVTPGGKNCMVALDKKTGKNRWESEGNGGPANYASAILISYKGAEMIVNGDGAGIFGVSAKTGKTLWQNGFSAGNTANCPTPAFSDGYVFWANGYGRGGICLALTGMPPDKVREAWQTKEMDCHIGGYVIVDGYIYGNNGGGWACLDLKTGRKMWADRGVGKGSLCYADGMLYLFAENGGRAALATASPDRFEMKGQLQVKGQGASWAYPVVSGGRLYLRYAKNLYCFDVRAK